VKARTSKAYLSEAFFRQATFVCDDGLRFSPKYSFVYSVAPTLPAAKTAAIAFAEVWASAVPKDNGSNKSRSHKCVQHRNGCFLK
jgi:hypothetical protein